MLLKQDVSNLQRDIRERVDREDRADSYIYHCLCSAALRVHQQRHSMRATKQAVVAPAAAVVPIRINNSKSGRLPLALCSTRS